MSRVLIAIAPKMYQQTVTLFLRSQRQDLLEVRNADLEDLEQEYFLFEPHLLVCHDKVSEGVRNRAFSLVEIHYSDSLDALVRVNDKEPERLEDIEIRDLLAVVDETEEIVSSRRGNGRPSLY